MPHDLKERVLEIVSIAKECPENLQPLCFELLLRDYLGGAERPAALPAADRQRPQSPTVDEQPGGGAELPPGDAGTAQQDVRTGDLHMKARKFMERHSISLDHLNQLFYKDAGEI